MLLHAAERPKRSFSRFCTLQKGQKEVFYAAAHCRKTKKKFFTLLHTAERPKRSFSRFCTLQKDQKEVFHASAHCRKAKKKFFMLLHTARGTCAAKIAGAGGTRRGKSVGQGVWRLYRHTIQGCRCRNGRGARIAERFGAVCL